MTVALLAGGCFGLGLWLVYTGLRPAREPLAAAVARLGQAQPDTEPGTGSFDERLGRWLLRDTRVAAVLDRLATDLRLIDREPTEVAAELAVHALIGLLWAPIVAAGAKAMGLPVPLLVPIWLAFAGAAITPLIPYLRVRADAREARVAFAHALSAFCDVVGMSMSAGREVYGALHEAATAGDGPAFNALRDVMQTGFVAGEKPWDSLRNLGAHLGIDDLTELGATLALAGDEGAAIRATVAGRARSIRERLVSDAEKQAAAATERMAVPGAMLMIGFLGFLTYPALAQILQQAH